MDQLTRYEYKSSGYSLIDNLLNKAVWVHAVELLPKVHHYLIHDSVPLLYVLTHVVTIVDGPELGDLAWYVATHLLT